VVAFRILLQIVCKTFEFVEWQMGFRVDAELYAGCFLRPTVPVVLPGDRKVFTFNPRKVVRSLNDQASIESPSQIRNVERIDVATFYFDFGRLENSATSLRVNYGHHGNRHEDNPGCCEPGGRLDQSQKSDSATKDAHPRG
jgi:hypothetical protein